MICTRRSGCGHGKLSQQDRVDEGEDRSVGANAQSEREHGYTYENRVGAESSQGVTHLLGELLSPAPTPGGSRVFARQSGIAENPLSGVARLIRRQAGLALLCSLQFQMGAELPIEIGIGASPNAVQQALPDAHRHPPRW